MSALIAAASTVRTTTATVTAATRIAAGTTLAVVTVTTVQAARHQGRYRNWQTDDRFNQNWFGGWQADHADGGSISRRQADLDGRSGKGDKAEAAGKRPGGAAMHRHRAATPTATAGAVPPPRSVRLDAIPLAA
ncbi:hypothetical protein GCM10011505_29270 [Tistrella bauzanensis]|uniref:Uncharacterized protein n=1 Tax=Tistrella bauzanensis TaxID=657419 RepID=A0ABQ1IQB7_9PROT|nr:hypothetical protein [Tistrella bauzanensis]GGB46257.1 hypothetical protein GCM10011505_29270 [Tistrella bauzanensis]